MNDKIYVRNCGTKGFGILEVLIAVTLFSLIAYATSGGLASTQAKTATLRREAIALSLATELLEFFRSLSGAELNLYLSKNPITGLNTKLYPLCSHINLLDRKHSTPGHAILLNADPLAELPLSPLSRGDKNKDVNRFYQVQVVNIKTQDVVTTKCGSLPPYDFDRLNFPDERFQVTVGVTWFNPNGDTPQRIVMTAILPD